MKSSNRTTKTAGETVGDSSADKKSKSPPARPFRDDPGSRLAAELPFDPWRPYTSTMQIAESRGNRAVHQVKNAREILAAKVRIERGDNKATLFAIVQCVEAGLVAPDWLAQAFLRCYDTVMGARAGSWDEVFGAPWIGTSLSAKRREFELAAPIVAAVEEAWSKGSTKDEALFAMVADQIGLTTTGGSYCRKIYYHWRKHFPGIRAAADVERDSRKHNLKPKPSTRKKKSV